MIFPQDRITDTGDPTIRILRHPTRIAVLVALAGALLFAGWQTLTVQRNFRGNWTALFCTGQVLPIPPDLAAGTYVFRGSTGYDGQMYRYVAHDPWRLGMDHRFLDSFSIRQRRILVPAAAWALALGRPGWIDFGYLAVLWVFVFAGCYWTSRWLTLHGYHPAWGLLYVLIPSTLVAADRSTIDVATSSLTVAVLLYARGPSSAKLFLTGMAICLSRETGFIPLAAVVLDFGFQRRWRSAFLLSAASLPACAWYIFVWLRRPVAAIGEVLPGWMSKASHFGIFVRMAHPLAYPLPPAIERAAQGLDILALLGMTLAFALAAYYWFRDWFRDWPRKSDALPQLIGALFVLCLPLVSVAHFWDMAYGYARPFSPLLICVALAAAATRRHVWLGLLPLLMILPRLLMQLGPQLAGIFGFHVL